MVNVKTIKQFAKTYSVTEELVKAKIEEFVKKELELGRVPKVADARALRLAELFFKKGSIGGPTTVVRMMVLGMKEAMDSANKVRQKALDLWNTNPTKAMQEGYTDGEGNPLDMQKDFGAKNPNKNYGKPLKPNWMRIVFGFNLATKKEMTFILKGDQAQNMKIPYFKVVELNGKFNDKTGTWNGAKSTKLIVVDESTLSKAEIELLDIEKLVSKHLKKLSQPIEGVEEWCSIHGAKDVLITEADVISVDMEPNNGGSRTIIIDNSTDYGQRMFVPMHVPIEFGEMSRVICISGAKPGKEDYGPTMTAMGLYPMPEYSYELENVESADNMIDYDTIVDENEPEDEDDAVDIGNSNDTIQDVIGGSEDTEIAMKTATPALILKVISSSDKMTEQQICDSADANGFSKESSHDAIKQLISDGEIECMEDTGYLIISEDEDTSDVWG